MAKTTVITDANERSFNEAMPQVFNPSNGADKKDQQDKSKKKDKDRRSSFYLVRDRAVTLFVQASKYAELLGATFDRPTVLKNCLDKALAEIEHDRRYNEAAFKKDLATRMAYLINDKRFDRRCKKAEWSLFAEAQKLSWVNDTVFGEIRDNGIEHVKGFYTPNSVIYELKDLRADLLALDVDPEDLDGDPYLSGYEERQKGMLLAEVVKKAVKGANANADVPDAAENAKAGEGNADAA